MLERQNKYLPEHDLTLDKAIYSFGGTCSIRPVRKADGRIFYKVSGSYNVFASDKAYENRTPILSGKPVTVEITKLDKINPLELLYKELDTLV